MNTRKLILTNKYSQTNTRKLILANEYSTNKYSQINEYLMNE